MGDPGEVLKATANAVEEASKTAGKVVDVSREFGQFISEYIRGSVDEGLGIFQDKLKYMRWERQLRLIKQAQLFMAEQGLDHPERPIKLKYAIPLFQAASLEDDDYIQDLWAKLLVNSSKEHDFVELNRHYISILENFTHLDADIFNKIYSIRLNKPYLYTGDLPGRILNVSPEDVHDKKQPNDDICLALSNLSRLGCISHGITYGGGPSYRFIHRTVLGSSLAKACSILEQ